MAKNKIYTIEVMDVLNRVVDSFKDSPNKWNKIAELMNFHYPDLNFSKDSVRLQWRRQNGKTLMPKTKVTPNVDTRRKLEIDLIDLCVRKQDVSVLADRLQVTTDEVMSAIARLQAQGFRGLTVWQEDNHLWVHNVKRDASRQRPVEVAPIRDRVVKIGVVSDTHIGNKNADIEALEYLYDEFARQGITTVLHVGDLTDGYYTNRPTSILEQDAIGFSQQLQRFCEVYPHKRDITTYAISGNHDFTFERSAFANIGEAIAAQRKDIKYLGHNFAKFPINDKTAISLIHPTDGTPQSLSLRLQQIIDRNEHRVSDIILVGHYHKFVQLYYKGVYGFLVPSLERPTGFMQDNNLTSLVGGLVLTLKMDNEGYLKSVTTEYISLD